MDELHRKQDRLRTILRDMGCAAVAFSAGVDSTFLLKTAHDVLGDRVIAVTAVTATIPSRETREAAAFCEAEGVRSVMLSVDVFSVEGFDANAPDRCYICKREILGRITDAAKTYGIPNVIEGSNADDASDYRPGMRAVAELRVRSPLQEAGLTKREIRALSEECGLRTWNKPSFACLATRIAHGERITPEKIARIDRAEQLLADLGFRQYRVRVQGETARIELPPEEISRFLAPELREKVRACVHQLGFRYVSLDLDGYRTGSMNPAPEQP